LRPEKGKNISAGFEFAPTSSDGPLGILSGLDVSMTYWYIRITNAIQGEFRLAGFNTGAMNNPNYQSAFLIPKTDPNFAAQVLAILSSPYSQQPASSAPLIQVIADTGTKNIGFQALDGVDFNINYDWDMGSFEGIDLGHWNAGVNGTYNIKNDSQDTPTSALISNFTLNADAHLQKVRGHVSYRGEFDNGSSLSASVFVNNIGHFGPSTNPLPPACFQLGNPTCASYGAAFAPYTTQSNLGVKVDSVNTFDLSVGYNTGDMPDNPYLKHVSLQLTVNNIFDTDPPFEYEVSPPGGGKPHAFYTSTASPEINPNGRIINIVLSKDW
jgi:hypothetical protein